MHSIKSSNTVRTENLYQLLDHTRIARSASKITNDLNIFVSLFLEIKPLYCTSSPISDGDSGMFALTEDKPDTVFYGWAV